MFVRPGNKNRRERLIAVPVMNPTPASIIAFVPTSAPMTAHAVSPKVEVIYSVLPNRSMSVPMNSTVFAIGAARHAAMAATVLFSPDQLLFIHCACHALSLP